jgi:hypothetical protein
MSDTIIDMPKVTQMLDAGWCVYLLKNDLGSYSAIAKHENHKMVTRVQDAWLASIPDKSIREIERENMRIGEIDTDDFTPEQALTRLAYKVHGEVI